MLANGTYCRHNFVASMFMSSFSCSSSSPRCVVRYKGEELIEAADGVVISNTELNGESVSSVLFDNCQIQDEAVIRAVAKNPAGEDNCSATFIVKSEYGTYV